MSRKQALIAAGLNGDATACSLATPSQASTASAELYDELYEQAAREAPADTLGWLAEAGYGYQALRKKNAAKVRRMSQLSGALGVLMVVQTLAWLAALAVQSEHGTEASTAGPDQNAFDINRHRGGTRRIVAASDSSTWSKQIARPG